jgi:hypothetical protein
MDCKDFAEGAGVAHKGTGYASLWALIYLLKPDVLQQATAAHKGNAIDLSPGA